MEASLRPGFRDASLGRPVLKEWSISKVYIRHRNIGAALMLGLFLVSTPVRSQTASERSLLGIIGTLEAELDARIGVFISESASDWSWGHRESERFLMTSTVKSILCAAVLDRVDDGLLSLDEPLEVRPDEIRGHSPVTQAHLGGTLRVRELCRATLDLSDNGATNLLIERLGGTQTVTRFLRRIGDQTTRLDRKEPELNIFAPGEVRDTTSPAAMVTTWKRTLVGETLSKTSRALLAEWMSYGAVTGPFIRAYAPEDWQVSDKSGGGRDYTRSIVAMVNPPGDVTYFVSIYISDTPADWNTRNAALTSLSEKVVEVLEARHDSQP